MSVHFPSSDLGSCYCCDQYSAKKVKAHWMADGYLPACDECYGDLNVVGAFLDRMFGEMDPVMLEVDRHRVELWQMMAKVQDSKEAQP